MKNRHIAFGLLFGFVLSRIGATDYNAIAGMFRLQDLHLMGVIGTAIALNAIAFWIIRRRGVRTFGGQPIALTPKPMSREVLPGALLFGAGWALAGACPGTTLAQIGEGRLAGLATFAGILFGVWLHARSAEARSAPRAQPVH